MISPSKQNAYKRIGFGLIFIILLVVTMVVSCWLHAEKIGDWYLNNRKSPEKSIYWYEISYNRTKSDEVLLKLGTSLALSRNYSEQMVYYPRILSDDRLEENQRLIYAERYIEAFYYINDFSGFKEAYRKYAPALTNNSAVVLPLQLMIHNDSIPVNDLKWALDFSNDLIKANDNLFIQSILYDQQSNIYERLGEDTQAALLTEKSKQIKEQLLK